jgi:hypothetical protein
MKKIFVKALSLAVVAGIVLSSTTLTAEAKTKKSKSTQTAVQPTFTVDAKTAAQVFDAEYYAKTYPDVVKVLGNDPAKLLNHYIKNGIKEGRDASATFNVSFYALTNPDLSAAFGENMGAYINHYLTHGMTEKRIASPRDLAKLNKAQLNAVAQSMGQSITQYSASTGSNGQAAGTGVTSNFMTNYFAAAQAEIARSAANGGADYANSATFAGWKNYALVEAALKDFMAANGLDTGMGTIYAKDFIKNGEVNTGMKFGVNDGNNQTITWYSMDSNYQMQKGNTESFNDVVNYGRDDLSPETLDSIAWKDKTPAQKAATAATWEDKRNAKIEAYKNENPEGYANLFGSDSASASTSSSQTSTESSSN